MTSGPRRGSSPPRSRPSCSKRIRRAAFVYSEHRAIAGAAIASLTPERAALLSRIWARGAGRARRPAVRRALDRVGRPPSGLRRLRRLVGDRRRPLLLARGPSRGRAGGRSHPSDQRGRGHAGRRPREIGARRSAAQRGDDRADRDGASGPRVCLERRSQQRALSPAAPGRRHPRLHGRGAPHHRRAEFRRRVLFLSRRRHGSGGALRPAGARGSLERGHTAPPGPRPRGATGPGSSWRSKPSPSISSRTCSPRATSPGPGATSPSARGRTTSTIGRAWRFGAGTARRPSSSATPS